MAAAAVVFAVALGWAADAARASSRLDQTLVRGGVRVRYSRGAERLARATADLVRSESTRVSAQLGPRMQNY